MAGVVNNCRHCNAALYDEETAKKHCSECGKSDWDRLGLKQPYATKTISSYVVTEAADEEGRKWYVLDVCADEQTALKLKGNTGFRRIKERKLAVFTDPPILRGIDVAEFENLRRYPLDEIIKAETLESIKSKLSAEELKILANYYGADK